MFFKDLLVSAPFWGKIATKETKNGFHFFSILMMSSILSSVLSSHNVIYYHLYHPDENSVQKVIHI